jgi:hypothetical protein
VTGDAINTFGDVVNPVKYTNVAASDQNTVYCCIYYTSSTVSGIKFSKSWILPDSPRNVTAKFVLIVS